MSWSSSSGRDSRPVSLCQRTVTRATAALLGFSLLQATVPSAFAKGKKRPRMQCEQVRVGFDVGSSTTKMRVLKVNVCKQHVIEVLFPKTDEDKSKASVDIDFAGNLIRSYSDPDLQDVDRPSFSTGIKANAERALQQLKDTAAPFKPTGYYAVATQAFRESRNAKDLVIGVMQNELKMETFVPLQTEEALLEWSAVADHEDEKDLNRIVSWGIGGGSMQFGARDSEGKFVTFTSRLASTNMLDTAYQRLQRNADNLIPISGDDLKKLVKVATMEASLAGSEIKNKVGIQGVTTYGVGGVINKSVKNTLVKLGIKSADSKFFQKSDIQQAVDMISDKDKGSEQILALGNNKYLNNSVTNLALVLGVMKALDIPTVYYSSIDNTLSAPFAKELGLKKVRQLINPARARAPLPVFEEEAVKSIVTADPKVDKTGQIAAPPPPPPPVAVQIDEKNSEAVEDDSSDTNQQICDEYGLDVVNGVCDVPESKVKCVPVCHGTVKGGKCYLDPTGKNKTVVVFAAVCKGKAADAGAP